MVSVRRCIAPRQHQYQLRRATKPKTRGDGGEIPAVLAARAAPVYLQSEMGDQKVKPGREKQVSVVGGRAVSGRSVQRKEGEPRRSWATWWMRRRLASHRRVVYFNQPFVRLKVMSVTASTTPLPIYRRSSRGQGGERGGGGGAGAAPLASTNITHSASV